MKSHQAKVEGQPGSTTTGKKNSELICKRITSCNNFKGCTSRLSTKRERTSSD